MRSAKSSGGHCLWSKIGSFIHPVQSMMVRFIVDNNTDQTRSKTELKWKKKQKKEMQDPLLLYLALRTFFQNGKPFPMIFFGRVGFILYLERLAYPPPSWYMKASAFIYPDPLSSIAPVPHWSEFLVSHSSKERTEFSVENINSEEKEVTDPDYSGTAKEKLLQPRKSDQRCWSNNDQYRFSFLRRDSSNGIY